MVSIKKILVVSSETALQTRLRDYLPKEEYHIIHTPVTDNNLKSIINEITPSIIVVDREKSSIQSVELSLRIRQWTQTPILILTVTDTLINEVRAMDFHAENYLSEPFGIGIAVERINKILSMSQ